MESSTVRRYHRGCQTRCCGECVDTLGRDFRGQQCSAWEKSRVTPSFLFLFPSPFLLFLFPSPSLLFLFPSRAREQLLPLLLQASYRVRSPPALQVLLQQRRCPVPPPSGSSAAQPPQRCCSHFREPVHSARSDPSREWTC